MGDNMQHFFIVLISAVGLSMDAFSVAIIVGMLNCNNKNILLMSSLVGTFHFIMPIIGNEIGKKIFKYIVMKPSVITGLIFLILSFQMLISVLKEQKQKYNNSLVTYIILSITVSIDSFSFGIGLSGITSNYLLASIVFMIVSSLFTFIGLTMGKKLSTVFGKYSLFAGSIILLILSIHYIIP